MRSRKFTQPKKPKEHFLVLCEGKTEETYVNLLRQYFHLPITIKIIVTGNSITARLLNQYINEMNLQKGDTCRIFLIYDGDIPCIIDNIEKLDGQSIITTPCIELWFALHHTDHKKTLQTAHATKLLNTTHQAWKKYTKGHLSIEQKKLLIDNMKIACERSKKLPARLNPSSDFHLFIEDLEKVKNR
ncbi:MAG: RloB family protein [Muribaculaceae bacterium]|nr:RloB family protein [Muribaculaceae bacterium]